MGKILRNESTIEKKIYVFTNIKKDVQCLFMKKAFILTFMFSLNVIPESVLKLDNHIDYKDI